MSTIYYKRKISPEIKGETLFLLALLCCLNRARTRTSSTAAAS